MYLKKFASTRKAVDFYKSRNDFHFVNIQISFFNVKNGLILWFSTINYSCSKHIVIFLSWEIIIIFAGSTKLLHFLSHKISVITETKLFTTYLILESSRQFHAKIFFWYRGGVGAVQFLRLFALFIYFSPGGGFHGSALGFTEELLVDARHLRYRLNFALVHAQPEISS